MGAVLRFLLCHCRFIRTEPLNLAGRAAREPEAPAKCEFLFLFLRRALYAGIESINGRAKKNRHAAGPMPEA